MMNFSTRTPGSPHGHRVHGALLGQRRHEVSGVNHLIERKHFGVLKNNDYVVCEKTDGERYMFICFRNVCALVNRRMRVKPVRVSVNSRAFQGTVLDGELYEDKFMVYDALVVNGVTVGQEDFLSRLEHIEKFINTAIAMKSDTVRLHLKTFYAINDFDAFARERLPNVAEATDGVVFTPVNDEVRTGTHDFMFKWKPQAKNTVDFQMGFDAGSWRFSSRIKANPCTSAPFHPRTWKMNPGSRTVRLSSVNTSRTKYRCGGGP